MMHAMGNDMMTFWTPVGKTCPWVGLKGASGRVWYGFQIFVSENHFLSRPTPKSSTTICILTQSDPSLRISVANICENHSYVTRRNSQWRCDVVIACEKSSGYVYGVTSGEPWSFFFLTPICHLISKLTEILWFECVSKKKKKIRSGNSEEKKKKNISKWKIGNLPLYLHPKTNTDVFEM